MRQENEGAAARMRPERVLVIRVRPTGDAGASARLQADVEALVDYAGLFGPVRFELDLNALNAQWSAEGNAYGKMLGAALRALEPVARAWEEVAGSECVRVEMLLDPVEGLHHRGALGAAGMGRAARGGRWHSGRARRSAGSAASGGPSGRCRCSTRCGCWWWRRILRVCRRWPCSRSA